MVDGLAGYTMLAPITIQYSRSICYLFRQRINFTSNCLKASLSFGFLPFLPRGLRREFPFPKASILLS